MADTDSENRIVEVVNGNMIATSSGVFVAHRVIRIVLADFGFDVSMINIVEDFGEPRWEIATVEHTVEHTVRWKNQSERFKVVVTASEKIKITALLAKAGYL